MADRHALLHKGVWAHARPDTTPLWKEQCWGHVKGAVREGKNEGVSVWLCTHRTCDDQVAHSGKWELYRNPSNNRDYYQLRGTSEWYYVEAVSP